MYSCEQLHRMKVSELESIANTLGINTKNENKSDIIDDIYNKQMESEQVELSQQVPRVNIESLKLPQLKEMAKQYKIKGYTKMKKQELVNELLALQSAGGIQNIPNVPGIVEQQNETRDYSMLTVAELKKIAKDRKIKGYTTMKKQQLVDVLKNIQVSEPVPTDVSTKSTLSSLTLAELKQLAKDANIKGYYKLNKKELVEKLQQEQAVPSETTESIQELPTESTVYISDKFALKKLTVKQLREVAKQKNVYGYLKLKKDELIDAIIDKEIKDIGQIEAPVDIEFVRREPVEEQMEQVQQAEIVPEIIREHEQIEYEEQSIPQQVYIDDVLKEIQVSDIDKHMKNVSLKILQCLAMY